MSMIATACSVLMSVAVAQSGGGKAASNIAVVNLTNIFERYQMTRDLEQMFDEQRQIISAQAEKKRDDIDLQRKAIMDIKPGSADFATREEALIQAEVEFQAWLEIQQRRLKQRHKDWLRSIYNDVQTVIARISEQRGIDLVLTYNDIEDDAPDSVAFKQQILLRSVIYAKDRVNLTSITVEMLDAEYQRRGGPASLSLATPVRPATNP